MSSLRWVDVPVSEPLACIRPLAFSAPTTGRRPAAAACFEVRARASTSLVSGVQGRLVGGREVAAFRGQVVMEQRGPWGWQAMSAAEPELVDAALAALRAAGELP